ncbi:MAG: class I SAM-dependent RNA methyltransferase [Chloroflexota bacterium]|nr:class I SAM-dependent RNA methyltransferase [Chloroflexota bacterium]
MTANTIILKMDKSVFGGDSLGRLPDGRAIFVPFALPGETIRVEIREEKKHFARGELIEIIKESPDRITPRCSHFGACGGCQYQNISYTKQLVLKEAILKDQFQRIGKVNDPPIQPIIPSPKSFNYRNTVKFQLGQHAELGYIHADDKHLLPIQECHLPLEAINELWPLIHLEADSGLYRLGIRQDSYNALMLIMEGEDPRPPEFSLDIPVSAVYTPPDAPLTILAGDDHLTYTLLEYHFRVSARSFFQVNTPIAEKMVQYLLDNLALSNKTRALELYAGVGLFSAFIAREVGHLTAVESSGSACHDFTINLAEYDNVALYEAEAEKVFSALNTNFDLLVVDPPRAGLAPAVHDAIKSIQPQQIAYISCDPATLARDVMKILQKDYRFVSVTPFDQFPQTAHIESISIFEKN